MLDDRNVLKEPSSKLCSPRMSLGDEHADERVNKELLF